VAQDAILRIQRDWAEAQDNILRHIFRVGRMLKKIDGSYGAMILIVILLLAFAEGGQALSLVRYPYIQNTTLDSVTIVWTTDTPGDSVVEYGLTSGYGSTASGDPNVTKHVVTIRNLSPGTTYYYRVRTGTVSSNGEAFKTAKTPDDFNLRMTVFGDSGDCTLIFPGLSQIALASQMGNLNPDLILHTGDIIYPNGEQWGYDFCYFPIYKDIIKSVPVYPAPGNHDYNRPSLLGPYLENFYVPDNATNPAHKKRYYSFNYGNAHFIALDTELVPDGLANVDQLRWLENDLTNSTDAVWKFVFFHQPVYSSGLHGSSRTAQNVVAPLAEKYNVDIVFTGHDHTYERTVPMLNNVPSDNGVVYLVTGGGGAFLYPVGRSSWTAFSGSFHHVTDVQIQNLTLTMAPVEIDGSRRDSYTLVKGILFGTVTNAQGDVLPNATLMVTLNGRQRALTPAQADGSFFFFLAEGVYDVAAAAPGCQSQIQTGTRVTGTVLANFVLQCQ
jgi:predicted phosphodiesterase